MTTLIFVALAFVVGRTIGMRSGVRIGAKALPYRLAHEILHLEDALRKNLMSSPEKKIEIKCGSTQLRHCTVQEAAQRVQLMNDAVRLMDHVLKT